MSTRTALIALAANALPTICAATPLVRDELARFENLDGIRFSEFGTAVDIDGDFAIAVSPGNSSGGFASIYEKSQTPGSEDSWTRVIRLEDGGVRNFGERAAIGGDSAAVINLRDRLVIFNRSATGTWSQRHVFNGISTANMVSLDMEDGVLVVGLRDTSAQGLRGEAWVYRKNGAGSWAREAVLRPDIFIDDDNFGSFVAVSGDTIAVTAGRHRGEGEFEKGAVFIYERAGTVWSQTQRLFPDTPNVVSLGGTLKFEPGGGRLAVYASETDPISLRREGSVYIFSRQPGVPGSFQKTDHLLPLNIDGVKTFGSIFGFEDSQLIINIETAEFTGGAAVLRETMDPFGATVWRLAAPPLGAPVPDGLGISGAQGAYDDGVMIVGDPNWSSAATESRVGAVTFARLSAHPDAPAFSTAPQDPAEVLDGQAFTYDIIAENITLSPGVTLQGEGLPAWLSLTPTADGRATLSGTPSGADVGRHEIRIVARSATGLESAQEFTLTVVPSTVPPLVTIFEAAPQHLGTGQPTTLSWEVIGAESAVLEPAGIVLDPRVGQIDQVVTNTTDFVLVASNSAGETRASFRVNADLFGAPSRIDPTDFMYETSNAFDYDEDGDADLITLWNTDHLSWLEFDRDSKTFGERIELRVDNYNTFGETRLHFGDADLDGAIDIVFAGPGRVLWYEADGVANSFLAPVEIYRGFDSGTAPILLFDVDGDLDLDVVMRSDDDIFWIEMRNGNYQPRMLIEARVDLSSLDHGDFDGDGLDDIVYVERDTQRSQVSWLRNEGGGNFSAPIVVRDPVSNAWGTRTGDLDGDGRADIVVYRWLDDVVWFRNDGAGGFEDPRTITDRTNRPQDMQVADLDGDGDLDVVVVSEDDDELSWFENLGGGEFGAQQIVTTAIDRPLQVDVIDFDGDGDKDLLMESLSDGTHWFENLNEPPLATELAVQGPPAPGIVLTAAYTVTDPDGDAPGEHGLQWFRQSAPDSADRVDIDGANESTYLLGAADVGSFVGFEVIPVSLTGASPGTPATAMAAMAVERVETVLTVISDTPDPSFVGDLVEVAFSLSPTIDVGALIPTGTISVEFPGADTVQVPVRSGSATLSLPRAGSAEFAVTYGGDETFLGASASESHEVYSQVGIDLAAPPQVEDEANAIKTRFTRDGDTDEDLIVSFEFAGTATNGDDYLASNDHLVAGTPNKVTIPAGSASTTVTLTVVADNLVEDTETLEVNLATGPRYSILSGSVSGSTSILDDDARPVAVADATYAVVEDRSLVVGAAVGVLANDTDLDDGGGPENLLAILIETTTHGDLQLAPDGSFAYMPDADYFGPDAFRYAVSDGTNRSLDVVTVPIMVTELVDLSIVGQGSRDLVLAGHPVQGNVDHVLTLNNAGPSRATGIEVGIVSVVPPGAQIEITAGQVADGIWTVPVLEEDTAASLSIRYTANASDTGGAGAIQTRALLAEVDQPVLSEQGEVVVATDLISPADLRPELLDAEPVLDRQTGLFVQRVRVANSTPFAASFRIHVENLPTGVALQNRSGLSGSGVPFVDLSSLPAGESIVLSFEFYRAGRGGEISPSYELELLAAGEAEVPPAGETGFAIDRVVHMPDGTVLLEWPAESGMAYAVEYSGGTAEWQRAVGRIHSSANRIQWVDNGLPKTGSHPASVPNRQYRIVRIADTDDASSPQ